MTLRWVDQGIPGVQLYEPVGTRDERGGFSKVFMDAVPFAASEVCWSVSAAGVVRGMHFQVPPHVQEKLVFVLSGEIRDLVLDLRVGSPTEGKLVEVELTPGIGALRIPVGCAHGFEALRDGSIVGYLLSSRFDAGCDAGVNLESVGFRPRSSGPLISERDRDLPPVTGYRSPFRFDDLGD